MIHLAVGQLLHHGTVDTLVAGNSRIQLVEEGSRIPAAVGAAYCTVLHPEPGIGFEGVRIVGGKPHKDIAEGMDTLAFDQIVEGKTVAASAAAAPSAAGAAAVMAAVPSVPHLLIAPYLLCYFLCSLSHVLAAARSLQ